ncbi:MAG: tRNA (adenosine(37)-N6)-threonylcarbamoyltransferase complex dimerization subunit type 1 TsaB [Firmicutes bacterium]|nr:tRNA (adenosine(37)-N6)-threonylcarbamoyltransferase complex dimerization subunit type 1 TsaB [Bacillota bacterium]
MPYYNMKTLLIDTHLWNVTIILYSDGQIKRKSELIGLKNNSEFIFPEIIKVLENDDIDNIIVINGPGSFTGVRLGVTIAKTLAYTLKIPIRVISSLECMAISSNNKHVAISDNNGYFIAKFNNDMTLQENYKYLTNEEFKKEENIVTNIILDFNKIYNYAINKEALNPHFVNPLYIKKIGVEK